MRLPADVAAAAQLACLLEASAPKPGNVSPGRHFRDTRFEDFLASAAAIGPAIADAHVRPVGATIRAAVEATARWTRANTNLGILLLVAPLARAAFTSDTHSDLRPSLTRILAATTVADASDVYAAIRLAQPGGLGRVDSQDVAADPTITLLEAMQLAAERDDIAREYATAFEVTFETAAPALKKSRSDGLPWDEAVVETFLTIVAARPDTHISRRAGVDRARHVSARARDVLALGGVRSSSGRSAIEDLDRELRDSRNIGNPGTAADITAAAIFVELLAGGFQSA